MFGQRASSHTVANPNSFTVVFSWLYCGPLGGSALSHAGLGTNGFLRGAGEGEDEGEGVGVGCGVLAGVVRADRGCMAMKSSRVSVSSRREAGMAAGKSAETEKGRVGTNRLVEGKRFVRTGGRSDVLIVDESSRFMV